MAQTPKHFQRCTAEVAVKALTSGSRRFLLADEVGLGKTVVAREVIAELARRRRGDAPFRVYYFGSGRTVTAQNAPRLCPEGNSDMCDANRPSLMAISRIPKVDVLIFRFTPETAVARVHGRGRSGVALERALLRVLISKVLHYHLPRTKPVRDAFRCSASLKGFGGALRKARKHYRDGLLPGHAFTEAFRISVREMFDVESGEHLPHRLGIALGNDPKLFVAMLREALTRASLRCLPPDLIVFDEFHKYRDRVFPLPGKEDKATKDEHDFLSFLPGETRPALLLLSATPFRQEQAATRGKEIRADSSDFHRLIGFLHGPGAAGESAYKKCVELFAALEHALSARKLDELARIRRTLERDLLLPCMARTERAAFRNGRQAIAVPDSGQAGNLPGKEDLELFLRFAAALKEKDKAAAVAYWRSIPYPHQFLGREYVAWKDACHSKWRGLAAVTPQHRASLRMRKPVPNARFRQLLAAFPADRLALPWVPPSKPWWPLRGPWASLDSSRLGLEKALLFSDYRATPRSIAGLMSFAVEDWAARQRGWGNARKLNKQSFLAPKSLSVVALFHPSLWLAETVDPVSTQYRSERSLLTFAKRSIRGSLPDAVRYDAHSRLHRPLWRVLPMLEREAERGPTLRALWHEAVGGDFGGQVGRALDEMQKAAIHSERTLSPAELEDLAWFALSSPGVVLLRSLRRHWPGASNDESLATITNLSWNGLRLYLDRPWFVARLMKGRAISGYPEAIQRAVVEGNLESVLDEHFWLPDPDHNEWMRTKGKRGRLLALRDTLGIRSAPVKVFSPGHPGRSLHLAAHAALPLTDTEAQTATGASAKLRADDLRQAFNTPFWPHVLCTTSVGQEGLDFHQWCRCVVHWDLCSRAVEVEQREGRVDRFKSLAIRRAVAEKLERGDVEIWGDLEKRAESLADNSGLSPWWIFDGARIEKRYFDPPSSDERAKKERLGRMRELYRLVLGLPHSHDMLARLSAMALSAEQIGEMCLDLGALPRQS